MDPGARAGPEFVQTGYTCTYTTEEAVASPLLLRRRFPVAAAPDVYEAQAA